VRAALLLLLFVIVACGADESENRDGGSPGAPASDSGGAPGATASCMLDGDCPPGEACLGALPGLAASGRCAARRDPGIAAECLAP
jgi:hypothetical protein